MPIYAVVVLAVVQGLTEFLPVSSKTHLLFAEHFLGLTPSLPLKVVLHGGSLLAILLYYWKPWIALFRERRREILPLVAGTVPAVVAALLFKDRLEDLLEGGFLLASGLLLVTGLFLFLSERLGREQCDVRGLPLWKALLIGMAQACALLPGISRSGSTIGTGYLCGLKREEAVRFSFFLGAIAITGALILTAKDLGGGEGGFEALPIAIGVAVSFVVSLAAIRIVEFLSLKGRFFLFSLYCAAAGVTGLVYFSTRG